MKKTSIIEGVSFFTQRWEKYQMPSAKDEIGDFNDAFKKKSNLQPMKEYWKQL